MDDGGEIKCRGISSIELIMHRTQLNHRVIMTDCIVKGSDIMIEMAVIN